MNRVLLAASAAFLAFATPAGAQDEFPLTPGEWVEIGMIDVEDGHTLDYANHLAGIWKSGQEYAKQQNWITDYEVLVNAYPRDGEPDVYLITRFNQFDTPEEAEMHDQQYREHMQRTIAQLESESGDRAEYRTVLGSMLLRKYTFRN